ncbi:triose-phosphate isomerase [Candidatus Azambacteria bacterium]|nr:triose-phosphate isomerase [Candidatus Azambacteria bacterium]MBI3685254.1 triose-phosphate isomerase [Candidatus Azambacteria bacterium]
MKLIIANWKAYVTSAKEARTLADAVKKVKIKKDLKVVLCPPFVFLGAMGKKSAALSLGAQDMFWKEGGPYTGEVTAEMLFGVGVAYVLIGHSERRHHLGETDEMVNAKAKAALAGRLKPVVCVGEKTRDDEKSIPRAVAEQTRKAFEGIQKNRVEDVIVAYEPVWAIGTGIADTPNDALSAAIYIRKVIAEMYDQKTAMKVKVLYGGSVDVRNAAAFVNQNGIDGVLVGRASTDKREFAGILEGI